jgi:hypothetical protein
MLIILISLSYAVLTWPQPWNCKVDPAKVMKEPFLLPCAFAIVFATMHQVQFFLVLTDPYYFFSHRELFPLSIKWSHPPIYFRSA